MSAVGNVFLSWSGRNALRRLAEALGEGGELVAAEESAEAAAAARGLSLVSGARGCRYGLER